jgi:hypothetical protein
MGEYPSKYWHCYVKLQGKTKGAVCNDLTFEQLKTQILTPWHQSSPFTISGKIITKDTPIEEIKVTQTEESQKIWAEQHNDRMRANGIADYATDRHMLPIKNGRDMTFELLFSGKQEPLPNTDISLIERICRRISNAGRILSNRPRKGKTSFEIKDEYDVQDLLHAILRAYLKYSVQEDPLSKVAGTKSSRIDISIAELGVLIEIKYAYGPDDQKRIFEEFSQDLVLYTAWTPLQTLFFVIYNSNDLRDSESLEKLSGPKQINGSQFDVRVILA